jgi:hypothetical protein
VLLEPRIEVEHVETALPLVSRGLGSTIAARAALARSSLRAAALRAPRRRPVVRAAREPRRPPARGARVRPARVR